MKKVHVLLNQLTLFFMKNNFKRTQDSGVGLDKL